MADALGTARALREALRAALAEAIRPHLGHAARRRGARQGKHAADAAGGAPRDGALSLAPGQWKDIGRDVMALHEGYTQRTTAFAQAANPIHERLGAYQVYYLPRNWYRVHCVLEALPWAEDAQHAGPSAWIVGERDGPTLRLLDLGCGTGAWSLAWLSWLAARPAGMPPGLQVHLTLVDQGHELLALAVANLEAYAQSALPGAALHCEVHADGVQAYLGSRPPQGRFAAAGAAMTLNELGLLGPRRVSRRATSLAETVRGLVRPDGCLLFVEPGTRRGYMNLMTLRDPLLPAPVLYPCPHAAPCPMWDGPVRHWCHATVRLPADFFFDEALRRRAGVRFNMQDLQFAALAVQITSGGTVAPPFRERRGERIVSAPMKARKTPRDGAAATGPAPRVVLACAPDGRLHERPAPSGGPYTRGFWHDAGSAS